MTLTVNKVMEQKLDSFLATKTCTDIDRTKFIPFAIVDGINKLTTCLVFNCNCHTYEDPTVIPCEYTGAVIHLPAFWLEVPKELAFTYILGMLNDLYKETYTQWSISGYIGNTNNNSNGNNSNSGCPCNPGWVPVN